MLLVGELAAIGTAFLFAVSSTLFTVAGRRAGAFAVNRARLLVAAAVAVLAHAIVYGHALPLQLPATAWYWLALSGFIGLAVGDDMLFRAFVRVGPAVSMLIFSMSPALAALLGWLFLDEALTVVEVIGAGLTLSGIAWVVSAPQASVSARRDWSGVLFAFGGAVGQAVGLVTAKIGMGYGAAPQQANTIRLVAAFASIWLLTALSGRVREVFTALRAAPSAVTPTVVAASLGPVIGVWLSLVAIERAPVGIASTLMSLTPLFVLPIARIAFHEPISKRAVTGALIAVSGVALLLL